MELHIFITCEEFITILNELALQAGCGIFIAHKAEEPYELHLSISMELAVMSKNIELGMPSHGQVLLTQASKNIYREDRENFVSVHHSCGRRSSDTLIETTFTADPSDTAKIISKTLRKILGKNKSIHKGIKFTNDKLGGEGKIDKAFYWSDGALTSGKIWRQAENSLIRFKPIEHKGHEQS